MKDRFWRKADIKYSLARMMEEATRPKMHTCTLDCMMRLALAQLGFLDFSVGVAWQWKGAYRHGFRNLIIGQVLGAKRTNDICGERTLFRNDHDRMNAFSEDGVSAADDRAFQHASQPADHVLDLGAENLEPAAIDHVLLAIEYAHETVRVHRSHIARAPEAIDELARVGFGTPPIAWHHHRPGDPELAGHTPWHLSSIVIDHLDPAAGNSHPNAVDMIAPLRSRHHGRWRRGLGSAISVQQLQMRQSFGQHFDGSDRHR